MNLKIGTWEPEPEPPVRGWKPNCFTLDSRSGVTCDWCDSPPAEESDNDGSAAE